MSRCVAGIVLFCMAFSMSALAKQSRAQIIDHHLKEFSAFQAPSQVRTAIVNVLQKMPDKEFAYVTDARRPVIFIDSGSSPYASSQEFAMSPGEEPCCQEGFTLIRLGGRLEEARNIMAIEGVIAHELAHRILEHLKTGHVSCKSEREANRLIKSWGFTKEFEAASKTFGRREGDPIACQENPTTIN